MKKTGFISSLLVAVLLFLSLPFAPANAYVAKEPLPFSAGIEALRGQFESGKAPETAGYALDYKYYSPVGEEDTTKYPLVIFLHGIGHGNYEGSQLDDSDMPYWSSKEYQERFLDAGGAFILLPRAPEQRKEYWGENFIEPLRALIDDFIAQHGENIDTTRISITGSSAGGGMVWFMLEAFPDYFATAFPVASTKTPSNSTLQKTSGTAVWIFASKRDPMVNYYLSPKKVWNGLMKYNDHPENCRISSFTEVYNPDGTHSSDNHHLAKVITCDMHTLDGGVYPCVETIDGTGSVLDLSGDNGIITWISTVHSDYRGEPGSGTGNFNINFFTKLLNIGRNAVLYVVHVVQVILGL